MPASTIRAQKYTFVSRTAASHHPRRINQRRLAHFDAASAGGQELAGVQATERVEHLLDAAHQVERLGGELVAAPDAS